MSTAEAAGVDPSNEIGDLTKSRAPTLCLTGRVLNSSLTETVVPTALAAGVESSNAPVWLKVSLWAGLVLAVRVVTAMIARAQRELRASPRKPKVLTACTTGAKVLLRPSSLMLQCD